MSEDDDHMPEDGTPSALPPEISQRTTSRQPTPVAGVPLYPTECARTADECRRWHEDMNRAIKGVEAAVAEHKLRLDNGSRVFTDIKAEIGNVRVDLKEITKSTTPKPVDWFRIVTWGFTALVCVLGSWWALSSKFAERPTSGDVREVMRAHADYGHPAITVDIRAIREEQVLQKAELKSTREAVDETRADVKEIKRAINGNIRLPVLPPTPTPPPPP